MARLEGFIERYRRRLTRVVRRSAEELSTRVIERTPVDTGALRASWTPNAGAPRAVNREGGGEQNVAAVAGALEPGDTYSLANGQPYVRRIEYEGHSPQAPAGMLGVSVAEWDEIVETAVVEARGGA